MSNLRLNKIKSQTPISILIHGGNRLGSIVAKTLVEQGSYVIIIDKFNSETKKYISELKKSDLVDFFDFKGFESIFKNIKRFDYLFYFLEDKLKEKEFDSKEFLTETKYLEQSLLNTKKYKAKFSLITSLELNRELANRVNNAKLSSPSPYSNMELQKYCETLVAEFSDKTDVNLRILRVGTVIGKGIEKVAIPSLDTMFKDATNKGQITIKGEGLDIHNLIHESDATYGILKLTFLDSTKGEVITLANKNNYTTLSLAYKLLELNTEAQSIRFVDNPEEKFLIQDLYVPAPHASKYGWVQQISLEEGMVEQLQSYYNQIDKSWEVSKDSVKKEDTTKNTKISKTKLGQFISDITTPVKDFFSKKTIENINSKKVFKGLAISAGIFLISYFLIYPIIGCLLGFFIISTTTKQLTTSFLDSDQTANEKNIEKIERNLDRISESSGNLYWLFSITGQKDLYNSITQIIQSAQYGTQGGEQLVEAIYPLAQYIKEFEPALDFQTDTATTTREYREYLLMMSENEYKLDEASYKISLASEILKKVDTNSFPSSLQDKILNLKDVIYQVESGVNMYQEAITFIPDLLGTDERKRYLILLQNESEMRSTGGWLTSYGVVGIEGGQLRELFVDDIYNADGTLKVQGKKYTAPDSMIEALNLETWSFSLVNWYPDLAETSSEAEIFTKDLGIGSKLDGVITIDIAFLQKLLDKWGGIEVPGEDKIITSANIYEKIFEMHEEFTPGSTQKTTFLANLANEIVKKILSMNIQELIQFKDVFTSALDEKHLQATFDETDAFNFFNSRNWSGSLDSKYNSAPSSVDWNWGGNKANLYLDKNYSLTTKIIDENTIDFAYTLSVENKSTSTTYPQGDYTNYQRIYIPAEATILKIDGIVDNDYSVYKENGFKVIGGWFNTAIQKVSTLEISYRLERSSDSTNFPLIKDDGTLFFDMNIFKQAGEKRFAYKLDISYPSTWNLESAQNLNSIGNKLSSRFELNKDTNFNIVWNIPN